MTKIDNIKYLYKPYRYTIKGKCTIVETTSGSFVIKKSINNNIFNIFNYLESRGFTYYPKLYDYRDNEGYVYNYIEEKNLYYPNKNDDLIYIVGLLHSKTSFNKEVREETFKEIYENIKNNILYLKDYYQKYFDLFMMETYMSPSKYEFTRNYSKIKSALDFSEKELDKWYDLVKNKKQERVSLIHNNLSINHFIKGEEDYLISWDNAKFDTPVLDLYKLYQNNFWELEFSSIYEKYNNISKLNEDEEKLFFILISLVPEIYFSKNEFECCKDMRKKLDYVFKTEEFLMPYYSTNGDDK